jgi:hypothetical protein
MSWLDNINESLEIITGDGQTYTPEYVLTTKSLEYNVSQFDFPEIIGTLVERGTPKSPSYPLEILFQGENHLIDAAAFEKSAQDRRPWTFSHPIFGRKKVQPLSLLFDSRTFNVTRISGEVIETISREYPAITSDPTELLIDGVATVNADAIQSFSDGYNPTVNDLDSLDGNVDDAFNTAKNSAPTDEESNKIVNAYNLAKGAVFSVGFSAQKTGNALIQLIGAPSFWATTVQIRLAIYFQQFDNLITGVQFIKGFAQKKAFETLGSAYLSGMVYTLSTPILGDFNSVAKINDALFGLFTKYNTFIATLDGLSSTTGGSLGGFTPSYNLSEGLSTLINNAASNLLSITVNGAQMRSIYLESDSNSIILAHRFYGPSEDESNLNKFINQNNIGISELLQIKKGRKLIYYV